MIGFHSMYGQDLRVLAISLEGKQILLALVTELGHGGNQVHRGEDWVLGTVFTRVEASNSAHAN